MFQLRQRTVSARQNQAQRQAQNRRGLPSLWVLLDRLAQTQRQVQLPAGRRRCNKRRQRELAQAT